MDPATALSVTCNGLQLFDVAVRLLSGAQDIYKSSDGATFNTVVIEAIADNVTKLNTSLKAQEELVPSLKQLTQLSSAVAGDLSDILRNLKTRSPHNKWQSFKIALKEMWTKNQIEQFSNRLQQLQAQITANIQFLIKDEQSQIHNEIRILTQTSEELGIRVQKSVEDLRKDVLARLLQVRKEKVQTEIDMLLHDFESLTIGNPASLKSISDKIDALTEAVSKLGIDMTAAKSTQDVLRTLRFDTIHFRYGHISSAHHKTFDWIFENEAPGVRGRVRLNFKTWLETEAGIFWIRGKAGSGKSTLLKFLSKDERTISGLQVWAGETKRLLVAKHFFWNPGRTLQKSQEGLARSLLFDILRQCPEHIPQVHETLLRRREEAEVADEIWTLEVLLKTLAEILSANTTCKICILIDGLDEFDGDKENVIQTIRTLASYSNVKICVSSRPWAEFFHSFGNDEKRVLSVEDLTASDIHKYAAETLDENPQFKQLITQDSSMSDLIDEIVNKSDGVFLWVRLVVRSLLEGLRYADRPSFLWHRLHAFPPDLDSFFLTMFKAIPSIYRIKAAGVFQTAMIAPSLPAVMHHFIDCVEEDANFAMDCHWSVMPRHEVVRIVKNMSLRLDGWTKGLLEVVHYVSVPDYKLSKVEFLHRTVRDFIEESPDVRQLLKQFRNPHQDLSATLCHASLAFMKQDPKQDSQHLDYNFFMGVFYHASLVSDDEQRINSIHPVLDSAGLAMMEGRRDWRGTMSTRTMCEYAAEYGLVDYIHSLLQTPHPSQGPEKQGKIKWPDYDPQLYTHLLSMALRSDRTSTQYERPWHNISRLISYLAQNGADPNFKSRTMSDGTIWQDFVRLDIEGRLKSSVRFEIYRTLVGAGADLDIRLHRSTFRKNIRLFFPLDQAEQLLSIESHLKTTREASLLCD